MTDYHAIYEGKACITEASTAEQAIRNAVEYYEDELNNFNGWEPHDSEEREVVLISEVNGVETEKQITLNIFKDTSLSDYEEHFNQGAYL